MNKKLKKIFTNTRVIILLICLLLALVMIRPDPWAKGVTIRNIISNSSAGETENLQKPLPTTAPMSRERIIALNNNPIENVEDYYKAISELKPNRSVQLTTNKATYKLITREKIKIIELNETINKTITEIIEVNETINGSVVLVNKTIIKTVEVPKTKTISLGTEDLGFRIYESPKTNIRKGLDLKGGTRVLLEPEKKVSKNDLDIVITNIKQRLNVYGLGDIIVRSVGDLSGNQYILVEMAGATEEEVKELLAKQGKFEATIGNSTVFVGGQNDVTHVCRSADCSGIDPQRPCRQTGGSWLCSFRFSIALSQKAAKAQADATRELDVITEDKQTYLSEKLQLYLDDVKVDELSIAADLKGKPATDISISGSGQGVTHQDAISNTLENMKKLQTVLITGSLPVKLSIIKTDTISPILGKEFTKNAMLVGLFAIIAVVIVIFIAYRKIKIAIPMMFTMASEVVLILGIASLIGWNLDLAAIAGIIIAVGTGVDHQIVITDEALKGERVVMYNWKEKIKRAFFIIMVAYFTTVVAMIPLLSAGAGLLKGFALTTIIGVSAGVFVTRPAYASTVEILLKE